ncbi:uncharacterized protein FIBRA_03979 [Fibroporia radiculosa]|uniref:Transmembrane protein n=1 Tax=Fibroporia radiculosa TaxID=599839 RepID=J4G6N8_9APHY|nr:uncharacterized protein FIBRA_03979 [Fibroporia radiculosa]CCM01908.1 predicted protein [Fibroporia radiculosa]
MGSLLDRFSPQLSTYTTGDLGPRSSLIDRISTQPVADPLTIDALEAVENSIASGATSPRAPSLSVDATEDEGHQATPLPVSSAAVDSFLASVLSIDVPSRASRSPSRLAPDDCVMRHSTSEVLDEGRNLFVSRVVDIAQRRGARGNGAIEERAEALMSTKWLNEMMEHGRKAVVEMQRLSSEKDIASVAGQKRKRDDEAEGMLIQATEHPQVEPPVRVATQSVPQLPAETAVSSPTAKRVGAPATLFETTLASAQRVMEAYLASEAPEPSKDEPSPEAPPVSARSLAGLPPQDTRTTQITSDVPAEPPLQDTPLEVIPTSASVTPAEAPILNATSQTSSSAHHVTSTASSEQSAANAPLATLVPTPIDTQPDESLTPTPPQEEAQASSASEHVSHVPGIWSVVVGSQLAEIMDVQFIVHPDVAASARRWADKAHSFHANDTHAIIHLLCLPTSAVAALNQTLEVTASPREVADAMWNIGTRWPIQGTIVVEVNPGHSGGSHAFLPQSLGPNDGALDVTAYVHAGLNTVRVIQLRDTSPYVFVIHATVPSAEEKLRTERVLSETQDWTLFLSRALGNSALASGQTLVPSGPMIRGVLAAGTFVLSLPSSLKLSIYLRRPRLLAVMLYNYAFPMVLGTFGALVLLILVTVSTPLVQVIYFLNTSADDGVKFGVLGYCSSVQCVSPTLGYTYGTAITASYILVLFPVAAALSLIELVFLVPLFFYPRSRRFPYLWFSLLSLVTAVISIAAFVGMVYIAAVALTRFQNASSTASLGPAIWMALASAVVLLAVAINSSCGTCFGGRFGRKSDDLL